MSDDETSVFDALTFREIQAQCKAAGLPARGKRAVLIGYLMEHMEAQENAHDEDEDSVTDGESSDGTTTQLPLSTTNTTTTTTNNTNNNTGSESESDETIPIEEVVSASAIPALSPKGRKKVGKADRIDMALVSLSPVQIVVLFVQGATRYLGVAVNVIRSHALFPPLLCAVLAIVAAAYVPGAHQPTMAWARDNMYFISYWVFLGVLSSVGLGTGLHTFVLYLGPHIAKVTMAAGECHSLAFETTGERAFVCPDGVGGEETITFRDIYMKVVLTAFLWGAGTAIGELPPYFIALTASKQGGTSEDLEDELEASDATIIGSIVDAAKRFIFSAMVDYGFVAILLCASIPNPLFDLAGLTCGHFRIPFLTFFSATLLGKAVVKSSIQAASVITIFQPSSIAVMVSAIESLDAKVVLPLREFVEDDASAVAVGATIGAIVGLGLCILVKLKGHRRVLMTLGFAAAGGVGLMNATVKPLAPVFTDWLEKQRVLFHSGPDPNVKKPVLMYVWELFLFVFIGYFVVSMVRAVAEDEYVTRRTEAREAESKED